MKRIFSFALALVMVLSLVTTSAYAATPTPSTVVVSPQNLIVDEVVKNAQKYNIDGANYFKLRDLAYLLNGAGSQFGVGWDSANGTVTITTGEAYVPQGGELETGIDQSKTAVASTQTIKINGETRGDLYVYNIGGANFFKLRELGTILGFDVDFDAAKNAATIVTKGTAAIDASALKSVTIEGVKKSGKYYGIQDDLINRLALDEQGNIYEYPNLEYFQWLCKIISWNVTVLESNNPNLQGILATESDGYPIVTDSELPPTYDGVKIIYHSRQTMTFQNGYKISEVYNPNAGGQLSELTPENAFIFGEYVNATYVLTMAGYTIPRIYYNDTINCYIIDLD